MHSGDLSEIEKSELSEQEKEALLQVMQRARQFDQHITSLTGRLEGSLYKWTNPLKGWQPRWFNVDQQQGVLHYYTTEDRRKQPPRGSLHLWGAVVAPSEEDSQSFSINGANGEIYKLRAADAKERQQWVSRLRQEVEKCTNRSFPSPSRELLPPATASPASINLTTPHDTTDPTTHKSASPKTTTPTRALSKRLQNFSISKMYHHGHHGHHKGVGGRGEHSTGATPTRSGVGERGSHEQSHDLDREGFPGGDVMLEVLTRLQCYQDNLQMQLDSYSKQAGLDPVDKRVLLLKATSLAAVRSVKDCLALMKLQMTQEQEAVSISAATSTGSSPKARPKSANLDDAVLNQPPAHGDGEWRERSYSDGRALKRSVTSST